MTIAIAKYIAKSEKITVKDAIVSMTTDNSIIEACIYRYELYDYK